MKVKQFLFAGSLAAATLFGACNKDNNDSEDVNAQDQTFIKAASMSNRAEIELGNLAAIRAGDNAVKMYGQRMVSEHTTAQKDLKDITDDIDLKINLNDSLGAPHTALRQRLMGLSGRGFDSVYMNSQVASHRMTLANFQAQINGGMNNKVKGYANTYLPGIQMHLAMADTMAIRLR